MFIPLYNWRTYEKKEKPAVNIVGQKDHFTFRTSDFKSAIRFKF
jgi:hypothetical protein